MSDMPESIKVEGVQGVSFKPIYEEHPFKPMAIPTGEAEYTIFASSVEFAMPIGAPVRLKSVTIVITGVWENQ